MDITNIGTAIAHFMRVILVIGFIDPLKGQFLPNPQTIEVGKTASFVSFNSPKIQKQQTGTSTFTQIEVALKTVETTYELVNQYSFFDPDSQLECECNCDDNNYIQCAWLNQIKFEACQKIQNETGICTNIKLEIFYSSCPNVAHLCCQMYFTANSSDKYDVVQLRRISTRYHMEIRMEDVAKNVKNMSLTLSENVNRILLDDIVMEWSPLFEEETHGANNLYIKKQSLNRLSYYTQSDNFNKPGNCDLNKVGWLQVDNDGLVQKFIPWELSKFVHLDLTTCNGKQSLYNWKLQAFHLSPHQPHWSYPLPEDINVYTIKDAIIFENHVALPQTNASINAHLVQPDQENHVSLEVFRQDTSTLVFLVKKKGSFRVSFYTDKERIEKFHSFIINNSEHAPSNKPYCSAEKFDFVVSDSFWICILELKDLAKQLCQFTILTSRRPNLSCETREKTIVEMGEYTKEDGSISLVVILVILCFILTVLAVLLVRKFVCKKKLPWNISRRAENSSTKISRKITKLEITEDDLTDNLTENQKDFLAVNIGPRRQEFWRKLGTLESEAYDFRQCLICSEGNMQAILTWEQKNGLDATVAQMKRILAAIDRNDLVRSLNDYR